MIIVTILLLFWHCTIYVNKFTNQSKMENKFTNIKDRVVEIAEKQDISKEEFFRTIGMTSANFRGKAKETPLNSNAIVNIITNYPEVDLYWLINGSSIKKDNKNIDFVNDPSSEYLIQSVKCKEKDKLISVLLEQISDLKADKEDLKKLLGLYSND
ncbi:hypothetical protein BTO18_16060 [Polaribacter porphyrae]|uniref:Uncharacterized protein n=2 Tax=Polaribacter porphyrae TaxID=1137780 RepID=A0A2S7WSM2_9FLAO|nr:hypothetical protein BTO18_16060 [Polaribacter porphyrae]